MGAGMAQMMSGIMGGQQKPRQGQAPQQSSAPKAVPEVMTSIEAAEYLKVPVEDLIAMVQSGDLKAKKIGSQYRISKKVIDEFLAS